MYLCYLIKFHLFFKSIDFDLSNNKNNEIYLIKSSGSNNSLTFFNCSWKGRVNANPFKINLLDSFVLFHSCLFEFDVFNLYEKQSFFNISFSKILINDTIIRFFFILFFPFIFL